MPLFPLLPLFHCLNREHFGGKLCLEGKPMVTLKWSDGRLRRTAGFYRRIRQDFLTDSSEIVLSRPLLENLPKSAVESTLCHEMIHAWIDLILRVHEGHGPNFYSRMKAINASQNRFKVSVRHSYPLPISLPKWWAVCIKCGQRFPYSRKVRGVACRQCCNEFHGGKWHESCLLTYELALKEA